MPAGTHFTTPAVVGLAGLMTQMKTTVRVATQEDALNAPVVVAGGDVFIGINNTYAVNIGEVTNVGFRHVPTYEFAESSNVLKSQFQRITDLEVAVKFGLQHLSPQVIAKLVGTGEIHTVNGTERILTGGTACATGIIPVELSAVNEACGAPAVPTDVETAVRAMIITLYRGQASSGWNIDDLVRANFQSVDSEFMGLEKSGLASSRSYWSAYFI